MRTIKFRVWNNVGRRMLYDSALEIKGNEVIGKFVMQFVGLKDKNGKEIFEGDIIKMDDTICEVRWDEDCSGWSFLDENMDTYRFDNDMVLEVIGNIYENRDLLEEANE